jgi:aminoglycoside phosphotransferase (APT) family kinase protein
MTASEGDLEARLLATLRAVTGIPSLEYAGPTARLTGGFWAELVAFRLAGAPEGLTGELVARVMPDPALARKETIIQADVAARGFPTPQVRLSGTPEMGLGRAFMVMDRAEGVPLLGGLDGLRALVGFPRLAVRVPDTLATVMAQLHRLDPAAVRELLRDGSAPASVPALVAAARDSAAALGRLDLVGAAEWLAANPRVSSPEAVCHGDLHPFNLLVDAHGGVTVLDWSAGLIGPRAYDVAFTSLVLAEPPVVVPRAVRPLIWAAGRWLSRRFVRRYTRDSEEHVDTTSLRWHQCVVCLRALVEVANWAGAGELDARRGHPWLVCGPAFAARLSALTGVSVRAR